MYIRYPSLMRSNLWNLDPYQYCKLQFTNTDSLQIMGINILVTCNSGWLPPPNIILTKFILVLNSVPKVFFTAALFSVSFKAVCYSFIYQMFFNIPNTTTFWTLVMFRTVLCHVLNKLIRYWVFVLNFFFKICNWEKQAGSELWQAEKKCS